MHADDREPAAGGRLVPAEGRTGPIAATRRAVLLAGAGLLASPRVRAAGAAADDDDAGPQARPWRKDAGTPPLSLPSLDGPAWDLSSVRGRPVVLNFWASWCEPCRAEMPSLELLATRFEREGLVVVAINFRETDATIARFLQAMPVSLPILRDRDGAAARAWQVRIFPTSVLIGRDGRAVATVTGEADWNGSRARGWIASLL